MAGDSYFTGEGFLIGDCFFGLACLRGSTTFLAGLFYALDLVSTPVRVLGAVYDGLAGDVC